MYIKEKRGIWYVIDPPDPKKTFDSEEEALAYVKGEDPVEPDDDIDWGPYDE